MLVERQVMPLFYMFSKIRMSFLNYRILNLTSYLVTMPGQNSSPSGELSVRS